MARRLRPAARPGRAARRAGPRGRRHVLHPPDRPGAARRPGADERREPDQRRHGRGRVRVLARPHGPLPPPARRAPGARLPRLVGHPPRRREHERGDAQPDEHLPRARPRQLPRHDPRRDHGPGDAAVPQRVPEPPRRRQRELRPRADGAVHARRGPRRVHGERRPRARTRAHRLARRLQQRLDELALGRGRPLGLQDEDGVRQVRPLHLAGRLRAGPEPPAARVVLRPQALELLRPDPAERRHRGRARAALRVERQADPPRAGGDPLLAGLLRGPAHGQAADRALRRPDARRRPRDREQRVVVQERPLRPAALLPAGRLGLERRALARHEHDARPLGARRRRARGPHGHGRRGERLPAADGRAGADRRPRGVGLPRTSRPRPSRKLLAFSSPPRPPPATTAARPRLRAQRFNALRQLVAAGPDYQTC